MYEDEEFLRDLMETFRNEGSEHIRVLSGAVVELEAASEGGDWNVHVETLFRHIHSLKGAAGAVGHPLMVSICQEMESVLAAIKRGDLRLTTPLIDALSEGIDCLDGCLAMNGTGTNEMGAVVLRKLSILAGSARQEGMVSSGQAGVAFHPGEVAGHPANAPRVSPNGNGERGAEPSRSNGSSGDALPAGVHAGEEPKQSAAAQAAPAGATTDTVRVATNKLESLMLQAEEFISVKLAANERSTALRGLSSQLEIWKREWYQARISGDQDKIEEFLDWNSTFVEGLSAGIRMLARSADDERRTIGPMVDDLLDGMKRVLMLPVSSLLSSFPKMVRDLARTRGKQVDLSVTGADIEIDKRIIENLKDPLVHILRNSVDHGIEVPEVRESRGKPPRGLIVIAVHQLENNKIQICVSDDGGGINVQRLRDVAVQEGLLTQVQIDGTDDDEALRLAFASGLSTSQVVSQVSGRGLGLAIVEEKVEYLGGSVTVETEAGRGTSFRITVPATLATARGILAQVSDWPFVMPVVGVDRVVRVHKGDVRMVENRETIQLEGRTLPLSYMHEVLDLPLKPQRNVSDYIQVVVAGSGDDRVAFAVDRIHRRARGPRQDVGPAARKGAEHLRRDDHRVGEGSSHHQHRRPAPIVTRWGHVADSRDLGCPELRRR